MYVTCVYVWVKPENVNDFIQASLENHNYSVKEPVIFVLMFCKAK